MACVTLKRPLDFDPLHTHHVSAGASCTPRPHKRRRFMPMSIPASNVRSAHTLAVSSLNLASSSSSTNASSFSSIVANSPFVAATPSLLKEEIAQSVREEIKRLKRRRMLQPRSMTSRPSLAEEESSSSDHTSPSSSPPRTTSPTHGNDSVKDKPLFSYREVVNICEKKLREVDSLIREEYEKVLQQRQAEQYSSFVCFTADQLGKSTQDRPTYLS